MTVNAMRVIDGVFGPLVCFVFYWYNLVKRIFTPKYKIEPDKVKNILLIKFFGLGSILLAGPLLRALRAKFPNARITFLTFADNKDLCGRIDLIDEVVAINPSSFLSFVGSLLSAIFYLRTKRCEISLDLEFFARSSTIIQYLCGARVRIGYYLIQYGFILKMMWRGDLLTHGVIYNQHKHTTETFLALGRAIGADSPDISLARINITAEDEAKLLPLFSQAGIAASQFLLALNINSSPLCLERRWPVENFAALADNLRQQKPVKIILIGAKSDKAYINAFLSRVNNADDLADFSGKLDIGGLGALFKKINLLITNDSGPMHLAASLGTPIVALFGPEIPVRFKPQGDNHLVFYPDIYCSPCLNVYNQKIAPCNGDNLCMRMISPQEVYNGIKEKYFHGL